MRQNAISHATPLARTRRAERAKTAARVQNPHGHDTVVSP
jgi:hypothetical protein